MQTIVIRHWPWIIEGENIYIPVVPGRSFAKGRFPHSLCLALSSPLAVREEAESKQKQVGRGSDC